MCDLDENEPYTVLLEDGHVYVVDWEKNIVLTCGDQPSAEHYATLMNRAFRIGYKNGVRKARKP